MTDNLVKRLRSYNKNLMPVAHEAADRIELLENILMCALADYNSSVHVDNMFFDWIKDTRAALGIKED